MTPAVKSVFGLCLLLCASWAMAGAGATTRPVRHVMDTVLPEIRFENSSLSDCIDFFADATGANIVVDWKALEAAKIGKDTPIQMRLGSVSFHKALDLVLKQAGGDTPLTYYIEQGIIQVTTQDAESKDLVVRIYPIDDLLFQPTDFTDAPQMSLTSASSSGSAGGSGGSGSGGSSSSSNVFGGGSGGGGGSNQTTSTTPQQRADEIIKLITDTVRPEVWKVNGGTANISYFRGRLIVSAPRSVQNLLAAPLGE